ncbi:hypothetical protein Nepgr_017015 [Nepenthes gracilis]|uniref:Uncharacterized protein n=1 Tax=Nepenthes gracilis TaxID=150966 RepID=A0AAD3SQR8_NEPGR|nr:hypothetical protein Nepgr_017015 [Nepenthes gracilis]
MCQIDSLHLEDKSFGKYDGTSISNTITHSSTTAAAPHSLHHSAASAAHHEASYDSGEADAHSTSAGSGGGGSGSGYDDYIKPAQGFLKNCWLH